MLLGLSSWSIRVEERRRLISDQYNQGRSVICCYCVWSIKTASTTFPTSPALICLLDAEDLVPNLKVFGVDRLTGSKEPGMPRKLRETEFLSSP